MDNLQDIFSSVLSDPEAVSKLRSLGQELGLTGNTGNTPHKQAPPATPSFDLSALSGLLGSTNNSSQNPPQTGLANSISPDTMQSLARIMPLLSGMNNDDEATALLNSLRPFLSGDKRRRLDEAGKMLRVMRILPKLRNTGLF
ncbi:MAG: hypothetical protein IJ298_06085 [Ruminococcus sp.]|nr:hypothetical protein [Ruminococcus sp.]